MNMQSLAAKPTKAERVEAFKRASWSERTAMHAAIEAYKADAMAGRRELGRRYLQQHPCDKPVTRSRAVAQLNLSEETKAARAEAILLTEGRNSQYNNGSLEFPVLGKDFPANSEAVRLATSPVILSPIVQYFDALPILFNMFVTRAHTTELLANSPHMFHLDPEDVISFKIFVHLTDVDEDCGPFHALPADLTQSVLSAVGYRGIARLPDEQINDLVGWDSVVQFLGPAGTVAFADTTRCLHFGGRPRKFGKPIRDMLVFQYLLPTSVLFPIDGDAQPLRFLSQLEVRGDDHWDALIGERLT